MPLSNDQIINSLVAFYARKGVDMSYVLGDPIFRKLPVEDQVEAVKRHAEKILAGTPKGLNSQERRAIGVEVASSTLGAGLAIGGLARLAMNTPQITNHVARNKALAWAAGGAAVAGLASGALLGRMRIDEARTSRNNLRNELILTAKNPTDDNAVGVLASSGMSSNVYGPRKAVIEAIINKVKPAIDKSIQEDSRKEFLRNYAQFDTYGPK